MYLIVETNQKVKRAVKCARLDAEFTRNTLHHVFPGWRVVAPGEDPKGPVQVVTLYIAREKNGTGRQSQIEQWGVSEV